MCIPVLLRYLQSLDRVVASVEALPQERGQTVLHAALAPDMLPFYRQVETAAYFALRIAFPLAGQAVPPYVAVVPTTAALRERIASTRCLVEALPSVRFDSSEAGPIHEKAGDAIIELPAQAFFVEFALPNFLFHLSMAYAIARLHGCPLGKGDFDGFHVYPTET